MEIRTDSMYVINIFTEWFSEWKQKGILHKKKNVPLITSIQELIDRRSGKARWTHTKGHNGIVGNECADRLARK